MKYLQFVIHLDGLRSFITIFIFTVENYFSVNKTRSKQTDPLMFLSNVELKYNHVFFPPLDVNLLG